MPRSITSRRDLIYALSQAAELEHALCCQYLFAAFSMKKTPDEGGVNWPQLAKMQDWQSNILLVARQEMEHLGLVCNLLNAIGAATHFRRPNFPQPAKYFGELGAFTLEPFSEATMARFVQFEKPEPLLLREAILKAIEDTATPDLETALAITLQKLGVDAHWDYGEVWLPDTKTKTLTCSSVWFCNPHGDVERINAFRQASLPHVQTEDGAALAQEVWGRQQPQAVVADHKTMAARGELAQEADMNSAVAVPLIVKGRSVAVLVFFFKSFAALLKNKADDQPVIDMVEQVLNQPEEDEEPNRLGVLLAKKSRATTPPVVAGLTPGELDYSTIGGFYRQIRSAIVTLSNNKVDGDDLFIGSNEAQVINRTLNLQPHWYNINLTYVIDQNSAVSVIDEIIEQGEGSPKHRGDSHYGRFKLVRDELATALHEYPTFAPARPVASNPLTRYHRNSGAGVITLVTEPFTLAVAELFNAAYDTMLQVLLRFYAYIEPADTDELRKIIFFPMMTMVIRPLGEILTQLPIRPQSSQMAGPGFELFDDVGLIPQRKPSWIIFHEQFENMAVECERLSQEANAPVRLASIAKNLNHLAQRLDNYLQTFEKGKSKNA